MDYSGLTQTVTLGLITVQFSLVDDEFGTDQSLEFNQGSAAETLFLRATVLDVAQPPGGEVPEPGSMALMGGGLLGLGVFCPPPRPRLRFAV
ncbi:MAG: PEP-CTERM sorting domain-containing protein [Acidobacteriota bacterium]